MDTVAVSTGLQSICVRRWHVKIASRCGGLLWERLHWAIQPTRTPTPRCYPEKCARGHAPRAPLQSTTARPRLIQEENPLVCQQINKSHNKEKSNTLIEGNAAFPVIGIVVVMRAFLDKCSLRCGGDSEKTANKQARRVRCPRDGGPHWWRLVEAESMNYTLNLGRPSLVMPVQYDRSSIMHKQ